jgi:cytosine/adenosine deaminase-related metal-dependent hydrolase
MRPLVARLHNRREPSRSRIYVARKTFSADIEVGEGRITRIRKHSLPSTSSCSGGKEIDLSGFLLMPGLIARDHLHFYLFPRLANPPYQNYIEWGEDIHREFPEMIALHKNVPNRQGKCICFVISHAHLHIRFKTIE